MQRSLCRSRAQLVLELENRNRQASVERSEGLIEALADLLLEALRAEESAIKGATMSSKVTGRNEDELAAEQAVVKTTTGAGIYQQARRAPDLP